MEDNNNDSNFMEYLRRETITIKIHAMSNSSKVFRDEVAHRLKMKGIILDDNNTFILEPLPIIASNTEEKLMLRRKS